MPVAKVLYKSAFWKTLQFGTSFLVSILIARIQGPAISAEFYSLSYLLALAVSCFTIGLDISLNYFLSRREVSVAAANRVILTVVVLALLVSLPLIWFYYSPSRYPHISRDHILPFSIAMIAGGLITTLVGAIFTAQGRNHVPAVIGFGGNLFLLAIGLPVFVWGDKDFAVNTMITTYFFINFLQGLILYFLGTRAYGKNGAARPTDRSMPLKALLLFSFSAFITNLIFYIGSRAPLYLIPYRASPADQGNFFQAYKIVEYLTIAVSFIYYPVIALVAGNESGNMQKRVLLLVRLSNTFVLVAVLLIAALGWWVFPILYGPDFDRMYTILLVCIPGLFAACSSSFFTAFFFGRGQVRINLVSACIQLICVLVLFYLFIRPWGIIGAAFAFSLSALASFIFDCLAFKRFADYRPRDLLFVGRSDLAALSSFLGRGIPLSRHNY